MPPAERPDLAFPFRALPAALVAAAATRAPGFGWAAAVCAVAFVLFALAAMPVERATGNRSRPFSAFLDACEASAAAIGFAAFGGMGTWVLLLVLGAVFRHSLDPAAYGHMMLPASFGCGVLAAHLGAVEVVLKKWRARPLDPDAERVRSPENRWTLGDGVTDLDGDPLPQDEVFFVEPPPDIGPVLSADSTLRADVPPPSLHDVATYPAKLAAAMGLGAALAAYALTGGSVPTALAFLGLGILLAFWEVWRLACPRHLCAFVGRDGAVQYSMRYPAGEVVLDRVVLFADARHAYVSEVSRPPYGLWYDYRWTDANGYDFVRLHGQAAQADRAVSLPVRFTRAAYAAWLDTRRDRLAEEYRASGKVAFPLRRDGVVEMDDVGLSLDYTGRRYRAAWAEVTHEWWKGDLVLGGLEPEGTPGKRVSVTVPGSVIADRRLLDEFVGGMAPRRR